MKRQRPERIEIERYTSRFAKAILDARANGGFYVEPPVYRLIERPRNSWLAKRLAEVARP